MACFRPLDAWKTDAGKVVFSDRGDGRHMLLPCGQCVGCRLERSRQWAIRCMHEASMHEENGFLTLTYNEEHCPNSLVYRHFQLFMKRARKELGPLRFYMCGEYGSKNFRPHYHALLFGCGFLSDRYLWRNSGSGFPLYRSPTLDRLWIYGNAEVGDVSFESAAYVARYCLKKVTGEGAVEHYRRVDSNSGEIVEVEPEFTRMSLGRRKGEGIGGPWIKKFYTDVYPEDGVLVNGMKCKPPRYYDGIFDYFRQSDDVEFNRFERALLTKEDTSPERLAVREKVAKARLSFKHRDVE